SVAKEDNDEQEKEEKGVVNYFEVGTDEQDNSRSVLNDVGRIVYGKGNDTWADAGLKHGSYFLLDRIPKDGWYFHDESGLSKEPLCKSNLEVHLQFHVDRLETGSQVKTWDPGIKFVRSNTLRTRAVSNLGFEKKKKSYCSRIYCSSGFTIHEKESKFRNNYDEQEMAELEDDFLGTDEQNNSDILFNDVGGIVYGKGNDTWADAGLKHGSYFLLDRIPKDGWYFHDESGLIKEPLCKSNLEVHLKFHVDRLETGSQVKTWDPGIKFVRSNTLRTRCFWVWEY
ncbi:hypothetical protein Tco_1181312, partial [Tanacetum coccineum]